MAERRGFGRFHGAALLVLVLAGAGVWWLRHDRGTALAAARATLAATAERGPLVQVVTATEGPTTHTIRLLGDARAYQSATLYAKVGGYLKTMKVDRGDRVAADQVLAEIESPETDQQYASAIADLENKRKIAARSRALLAHGNVAVQAADQADTDLRTAEASLAQLAAMKSYEVLRAPFAGRVTARYLDPGALVSNAVNGQTNAPPVLSISDASRLRVDVHLPQEDAAMVHVHDAVRVIDPNDAGRALRAEISRSTGELDPQTRTLLIEIDLDNHLAGDPAEPFLAAGSFAYVEIAAPVRRYARIPASALMIRANGTFAATVGADSLVHFRRVKIASTDGTLVDIADGLKPGDRIALNLPNEVTDGSRIQPVALAQAP